MMTPTGKATTSHCPKAMAGASGNSSSWMRAKARFGGVPTRVARPPAEQP